MRGNPAKPRLELQRPTTSATPTTLDLEADRALRAPGGLSLNLRIGMGDPGELKIYRVDMTRVS